MRRIYLSLICFTILNNGITYSKISDKDFYSPLSVDIKIDKNIFQVGEEVTGEVIIVNTYPTALPANFHIKLFRDDELVSERTTSVKRVPEGTTKFSFHAFGVPFFNNNVGTEGDWHIVIVQQNVDPAQGKQVSVIIVPSTAKKDKTKDRKFKTGVSFRKNKNNSY